MAEETHRFVVELAWRGSTGLGYEGYDRSHEVRCPPARPALSVSAAPAFHGHAELVDPEQLLLAAAASCQLLSFLAVAARARLDVREYIDHGAAEMPTATRGMRITRVTLRPHIVLVAGPSEERVRRLVEQAHRECYIANTLACEVVVEPTVELVRR